MKVAIAIFVKTPGLSPIKTRLAKDVGRDKAEEIYVVSVKAVEEAVREAVERLEGALVPYWAVAEKEGLSSKMWSSFDVMSSGEGDLGMRLTHVYSSLFAKYDFVLMIGSDNPEITPDIILQAIQGLKSGCGYVIGPAYDGGFYLFGSGKRLSESQWCAVPYSREDTRERLIEEFGIRGDCELLEFLTDIDDLDSLRQVGLVP